jgi:hypothetical protein
MFMAMHEMQRHVVVYIVSVWQNKQAKSEEFSVCALSDQDTWKQKKTGFEAWVNQSIRPSGSAGLTGRSRDNFWKLQGCSL